MLTVRWSLLGIALLGLAAGPESPSGKVAVKVAKYDDLADTVRRNLGQVVLVDFWSTTCGPCRKKFPHLVEMHRKYAEQGLAVVSVSIDEEPDKPEVQAQVLNFLKERGATFTNLILDEPYEVWGRKFDMVSPPCVFVFDRRGRWKKLDSDVLADDPSGAKLEKLLAEWLK